MELYVCQGKLACQECYFRSCSLRQHVSKISMSSHLTRAGALLYPSSPTHLSLDLVGLHTITDAGLRKGIAPVLSM